MDGYSKNVERLQRMLQECDVLSDAEDDSEGESDFVIEDEVISDSECYDSEHDEPEKQPCQKHPKFDGWLGKDKKSWWQKEMPNLAVRTRPQNIIRERPGPRGPALQAKTPYEFWELFVTPEMLELLVEKTNLFIRDKRENYTQKSKARDTDNVEMKAFLGLLLLAGTYHSNRMNLDDLWKTDGTGIDVFRLTMSLHRFRFLLCCIRFDDKATRGSRKLLDKLAPIRDLFETFVQNCLRNYSPSEFVTIDEMLVAFRGRCPFRQYIPNKPAKYGIKIQAMADARTYYTCKMEVYAGKQPDGPFKVDNSSFAVVTRLISEISGSGRNVTFDNWYTTYPLVVSLLHDHKLSAVGTLRKNKREIPDEFLSVKNRAACDSMFGFGDNVTLVSYVPQTKQKKNVVLFSSMHHDDKIDPESGEMKKPEIITFYNSTKGGVDMVDQMAGEYDTSRNSRRWPLTVFYTLLNVSTINAYILYCHNPENKLKRHLFIKNVSMQLVQEALKRRLQNIHLSRDLKSGIRRMLPESEESSTYSQASTSNRAKRCELCERSRDRKVKTVCTTCGKHVCKDHSKLFVQCITCHESASNNEESEEQITLMAIRLEKDYRVLVLVVSYRTLIALQFRFIQ